MSVNPSIGLLAVRQVAALVGAAGSPAPVARTDQTEYTEDRLPAYNVFARRIISRTRALAVLQMRNST